MKTPESRGQAALLHLSQEKPQLVPWIQDNLNSVAKIAEITAAGESAQFSAPELASILEVRLWLARLVGPQHALDQLRGTS